MNKRIIGYMVMNDKRWAWVEKKIFKNEEEYLDFKNKVECLCGPMNVYSVHKSKNKALKDVSYLRSALKIS